jgi:hypothetical protein
MDRAAAALGLLALLAGPGLFMGSSSLAAQPHDPARTLSVIPGEVMFLRATGQWRQGDREGPSRIVLLRTSSPDGAMRLFVQWLAVADQRTGRIGVVATEEIPEVFDWRVKIEDYRIEPELDGARVMFDGVVLTSGQKRRYMLTIGPPGEVMFSGSR